MPARSFLTWIFFFLAGVTLQPLGAQRPGSGGSGSFPGGGQGGFPGSGRGGSAPGGGNQREIELDTFPIAFHLPNARKSVIPFRDTGLGNDFHQHDPARRERFDYFHLGYPGSAAYPLYFEPLRRKGFDLGIHAFDLYLLRADQIPIYQLERAFTQATFYQTGEQNDGYFGIQFSRNFSKGLNLSLNYRRINQLGPSTHFSSQKGKVSSLGLSFWWQPPGGRYTGYLLLASNEGDHKENGGITRLPDPGADFFSLSLAEVRTKTGTAAYHFQDIGLRQFFTLLPRKPAKQPGSLGAPEEDPSKTSPGNRGNENPASSPDKTSLPGVQDSQGSPSPFETKTNAIPIGTPGNNRGSPGTSSIAIQPPPNAFLQAVHRLGWRDQGYLYFDNQLTPASSEGLYRAFLTDSRGMRHQIRVQTLENYLGLHTAAGKGWRLELDAGLGQYLHFLRGEPLDSQVHNLALEGVVSMKKGDRLTLLGEASLQLLGNRGDYQVSGQLALSLGKGARLGLSALHQRAATDLMQQRFFVSQRLLWDNAFAKTTTTRLSGTMEMLPWQSSLGADITLLTNPVYFDTEGKPMVFTGSVPLLQAWLKQQIRRGIFNWEGQIALQITSNPEVIPLPLGWTRQTLSLDTRLFKVLETRLGLELRYFTPFRALYYFPLTAQFQRTESSPYAPYPLLDAFGSFKVTKFRIFLKWEDALAPLLPTRYAQVHSYFFPNGGLRLGFRWRFFQ